MVNVCSRKYRTEGCGIIPSFEVAGTKTTKYCARHALDEMVNVCSKKSITEGCGKISLFRVPGTKTVEYYAHNASNGMVDICSRKSRTEGCGKVPSFGVAGTKTAEYCARHAPDGMVNVCSRKSRTSAAESSEPEAAARYRRSEWQLQKRRNTVLSTPEQNAASKDTGRERLAHTTPGRKS